MKEAKIDPAREFFIDVVSRVKDTLNIDSDRVDCIYERRNENSCVCIMFLNGVMIGSCVSGNQDLMLYRCENSPTIYRYTTTVDFYSDEDSERIAEKIVELISEK